MRANSYQLLLNHSMPLWCCKRVPFLPDGQQALADAADDRSAAIQYTAGGSAEFGHCPFYLHSGLTDEMLACSTILVEAEPVCPGPKSGKGGD